MRKIYTSILFLTILSIGCQSNNTKAKVEIPDGFIRLHKAIPGVIIESRYFGSNNFIGKPIDGYNTDSLVLSNEAAAALVKVQKTLIQQGYELKVFDAYRPQKSVDHFVKWAKELKDLEQKNAYYPEVNKVDLFELGYIAEKSGHSRGSTVDITLVYSHSQKELDMGTPYDYFSPKSWPSDTTVSNLQYNNRMMLKYLMEDHGFNGLKEEWWHFTLKDEPFVDTYFDFEF